MSAPARTGAGTVAADRVLLTGASAASDLWRLGGPLIGVNLLNVFALAIDTAMCGALPDAGTALAGLGFATQLVYLLAVAATGVSVGTVALVARAHGAGSPARSARVLGEAIWATLGLSLAIALVGAWLVPPLLRVLGATGDVLDAAERYVMPLVVGSVFHYLALVLAAGMRGVGQTLVPLAVGVFANGLNALLNYGLILGHFGLPRLGVQGAALGTLVAHASTALALAVWLLRGRVADLPVRLPLPRPRRAALLQLAALGAPAALDFVLLNLGYLAVIALLGQLDARAVAAHAVGMRVLVVAFIPALSLSQALAALVGRHLGAGAPHRARAAVRSALWLAGLSMGLTHLLVLGGADSLLALFRLHPGTPTADLAAQWLRVVAWSLPILGVNIVFVGWLQGAGETRRSLRYNLAGTLLVQLPFGYLAAFVWGLGPLGAWLSVPVGFAVRALLGAQRFLSVRGRFHDHDDDTPHENLQMRSPPRFHRARRD